MTHLRFVSLHYRISVQSNQTESQLNINRKEEKEKSLKYSLVPKVSIFKLQFSVLSV